MAVTAPERARFLHRSSWLPYLFGLTLFLSAALLFLVQLMLGKMIVPLFGGVPAVWNTCMVFFQAALLAGYLYSHVSITWLGVRRQAALHVAVLLVPLLVLPIAIRSEWVPAGDANPVAALLLLLLVSVGLPFSCSPPARRFCRSGLPPLPANPRILTRCMRPVTPAACSASSPTRS